MKKQTKQKKPDKSKAVCIVLAILFSFWSWLYTYKYDSYKFWIGLALTLFGWWIAFIPVIAVYIWAIVDAAIKNQENLKNYY